MGALEGSNIPLHQPDSLAIKCAGVKFLYNNTRKMSLKYQRQESAFKKRGALLGPHSIEINISI